LRHWKAGYVRHAARRMRRRASSSSVGGQLLDIKSKNSLLSHVTVHETLETKIAVRLLLMFIDRNGSNLMGHAGLASVGVIARLTVEAFADAVGEQVALQDLEATVEGTEL
jgi:hypothetical protein